jgi:protease IV
MVKSWMTQTYKQFTERVMTTRTGKIQDIDKVARGRIFVASQAKALGMIDEIGGLEETLAYAAKKVNLAEGDYDVKILPTPKTLADLLTGNGADAAFGFKPKIELKANAFLPAGAPELNKALSRQLQMLQLLQQRPVVLIAPYTLTIK